MFSTSTAIFTMSPERKDVCQVPTRKVVLAFSFASFSDPDGNSWLLQEVKARFPGRGLSSDVATVTDLLREAEAGHGEDQGAAPKHHWSECTAHT